jgi:peptidoglycan/LPS O-acetylase OafA/YrhL
MEERRIYFKNLNALRFIAAVLVIFHHIEQYKMWAKLPNFFGTAAVDALGHKAVSFFFVISGFLITYLLLSEHKKTADIDVRNFYIRRILRIWPLYYLIVIVSLFAIPNFFNLSLLGAEISQQNFPVVCVLLLLVLPNLVRLIQPSVVGGNQLWSIGVEEQFYLIWPLLVRFFIKALLYFLVAFIALKITGTVILEMLTQQYDSLVLKKLLRFWVLLQVEQMAIGAMGAWILFYRKENLLNKIYHPYVFRFSLTFVALLFIVPIHHWFINYAEAIIFVIVIMNLSTNKAIKFSMESKLANVLGNISYGIYMYHTICITCALYLLRYFEMQQTNYVLFNITLYTLSTFSTIAVAYYSYEFFEKKFLELKEQFMVVKSGVKSSEVSSQAGMAATRWYFIIKARFLQVGNFIYRQLRSMI